MLFCILVIIMRFYLCLVVVVGVSRVTVLFEVCLVRVLVGMFCLCRYLVNSCGLVCGSWLMNCVVALNSAMMVLRLWLVCALLDLLVRVVCCYGLVSLEVD